MPQPGEAARPLFRYGTPDTVPRTPAAPEGEVTKGHMKFSEIIEDAKALLQRQGRLTYRSLKREFDLEDDVLRRPEVRTH